MKLKLAAKMVLYFLFVVLVAAIGFTYTVFQINTVVSLTDNVKSEALPRLLKTNQINNNVSDEIADIRGYYITKNQAMLDDYMKKAAENTKLEEELFQNAATAEGKKLVGEVKQLDDQYSEIVEKQVLPLLKAGKEQDALQVMTAQLTPTAAALSNKVDEYQAMRNKQINQVLDKTGGNAHKARIVAIVSGLLAAILGVLIGFFGARSLVKPITILMNAAQKVANGDLTVCISINRQDEIGQLGNSFNDMIVQLKKLIQNVTSGAEQVAASSQELTASSEQAAQAANQVTTAITDVANGANEQMEATKNTTSIVEQMSAGIQQIAANANLVADQSAQATDKAGNGNQEVDEAVLQMKQIENTVNHSAAVVEKLGERSKEIGEIVNTISGIAGQTNLLALNAAIEAARAGEQGRGFTVVAEEVRKLAEQSQEAAKQISALIGDIQTDTENAVVSMHDGNKEVRRGMEVVTSAGAAFKDIKDEVGIVSDQVREISAAIQQMAVSSQQIVDLVKEINALSKSSATDTQSVSAATEEQLASMEEIAGASQALAKLAQELQNDVSKFHV